MTLSASKIATLLGIENRYNDNTQLSILLTDSRNLTYPERTVFFALRTPGNDGHNFIDGLYLQGVKYFVTDKYIDYKEYKGATFWHVDNVLDALQRLAIGVRSMFDSIPVIGITGSRGKTVVKEYLFDMLRYDFNIARSPRSYNSQIGVPLSIWEMTQSTTLAIFEAGISQPGEMQRLQPMIRPTLGIFTAITDEHSADFASLREKACEKAILFKDCPKVYYHADEDGLILDALTKANPKGVFVPIAGANKDLAIAVAKDVLGPPEANLKVRNPKISPRINVCETLKNCLIIFDGYTSDLRSLYDGLNLAKRHLSSIRAFTAIMEWPTSCLSNEDTVNEIISLLKATKVERLIAIGFPMVLPTDSCLKIEQINSVDDFLQRYSISDFKDELIFVKGDVNHRYEEIEAHLEAPRHETIMEVDLGAIIHNFNFHRSCLPAGTGIVAMVKADGYGVGSIEISKALQNQGAAYLAVAVVDEGAQLRRAGITMPIIVMNPISTNYAALFDHNLEPSVFSLRELDMLLDNANRLGVRDYPVHIKLDTGMHRLGFLESEIPALIERLSEQQCVKVASVFSHLATADCLDQDEYTEMQLASFDRMSEMIAEALPYPIKRHILNTAGILRYPQHHYDMARLGIGLYGVSPIVSDHGKLQVVARLFTRIISLKAWDNGITIGYGRKGKVTKHSIIATIPIGYADGLNRHLSNGKASFIVNGVSCPVVGNICMDQCMIDVTNANASIGDKVEIFGENAPIERLSSALDTIPYEILTSVSPRVKRIYHKE